MTGATEQVDAKKVSSARNLISKRAKAVALLVEVEADPSLFAEGAVKKLDALIAEASSALDSLPPSVRAKAMTPGQLNDLISNELGKQFTAWYPKAFAGACKLLNIEDGAVASKEEGLHSVSILGRYDHATGQFGRRPQLDKMVTISRKGLK